MSSYQTCNVVQEISQRGTMKTILVSLYSEVFYEIYSIKKLKFVNQLKQPEMEDLSTPVCKSYFYKGASNMNK